MTPAAATNLAPIQASDGPSPTSTPSILDLYDAIGEIASGGNGSGGGGKGGSSGSLSVVAQQLLKSKAAQTSPEVQAAGRLLEYYAEPWRVGRECGRYLAADVMAMLVLGLVCRLLVGVVLKVKVSRGAQS